MDVNDAGRHWLAASAVQNQQMQSAALYVVATPIGNLADISLRALWVLTQVDAIAAEDTRVTRPLLERFGINVPLLAAHEHNEREAAEQVVVRLQAGQRVALVTDAGTPAISDPGAKLVKTVRAAGFTVVPIPGASSVLAALSVAGLTEGGYYFLGFLPNGQQERDKLLKKMAVRAEATVLLESPHRLRATAQALSAVLEAERGVLVARELTKRFESIDWVPAAALNTWFEQHPPRGEYVLVIGPQPLAQNVEPALQLDSLTQRWLEALAEALPPSRAAAVAAKASGLPRELLYQSLKKN